MMNTHHFGDAGLLLDCLDWDWRPRSGEDPIPQTLPEELTLKTTVLLLLKPAVSRPALAHRKNGILASRADAEEEVAC
jgi:hypothetical protein